MTELEKEADDYYYKTYTTALNIGEEERYKIVTSAYIAALKSREELLKGLNHTIEVDNKIIDALEEYSDNFLSFDENGDIVY